MSGSVGVSLIGAIPAISHRISFLAPSPSRLTIQSRDSGRKFTRVSSQRIFPVLCQAVDDESSSASDRSRGWRKIGNERIPGSELQKLAAQKQEEFSTSTESEESVAPPPLIDPGNWRLFSNLNGTTLKHEPGSLSGSILLVAGTTVGAGILAIPAVTQDAGFLPSAATCVVCWIYMLGTGLLVAEVNINTMCGLGSGGVSLVSMASRTLGQNGVRLACAFYIVHHYLLGVAYVVRCSDIVSNTIRSPFVAYLFIHYALLVAYVARSSEIVSTAIGSPLWLSASLFTAALGGLCYFSSQRLLDLVNGILVGCIVSSFAVLVGVAAGGLQLELLLHANVAAVSQSVPIIALSFVYQNVVPVICTSLEGDLPKIRTSIILGTGVPLVMFLIWDAVILGSLPFDSNNVTQKIVDPLLNLQASSGIVGPVVQIFSFFAVATSYIGFVLGLADFIADLLKLPSGGKNQSLPYLLTVVPPLALALTSPDIFFDALDFAGTYGVMVLFGILPAAMAWSERYSETCLKSSIPPLVPGGRVTLSVVIGFAVVVISSDLWSKALP